MSTFKSALLACTVGLAALGGCKHDAGSGVMTEEQRIAALYALGDVPLASSQQADENALRAMLEGLGDSYTVSVGAYESDKAGDVARDVVIGYKVVDGVELKIDEMRAWGATGNAQTLLQAGQSARIADRIDMRGLSISGFETFTQKVMDGYLDAVEDAVGNLDPNAKTELEGLSQEVSKYAIGMDHLVLDGMTLYPLSAEAEAYKLEAEAAAEESELQFKDAVAAFARLVLGEGYDAVSGSGLTGEFSFSQTIEGEVEQDISMNFGVSNFAYKDAHRGDVGFLVMDDMSMDMDMDMAADADTPMPMMTQTASYSRYIVDDWKFSTLLDHLSRGEVPSMDVEELMSLGRFRAYGMSATLNDKPYYSVAESSFDMSNWRWFIPTNINMSIKGAKFHTTAVTDLVGEMVNVSLEEEDASASQIEEAEMVGDMMSKFADILKSNSMDEIGFNFDMDAEWNPDTGAFDLDYDAEGFDLMREIIGMNLIFPTYAEMKALAPAEGEELDADALGELFTSKTKFDGFSMKLDDNGLIGKIFSLVHDGAMLVPEEEADENVVMLQNTSPDQMREMAQGLIRMAGFAAKDTLPDAVVWVNDFADFIQSGGTFEINAFPETPFGMAEFEARREAIQADPSSLVGLLGVTVEHVADEDAGEGPD